MEYSTYGCSIVFDKFRNMEYSTDVQLFLISLETATFIDLRGQKNPKPLKFSFAGYHV
jgi:hypothetical protein